MARYVYDPGRDMMVHRETGEPMVSGPFRPVTPMHVPDIPAYVSPVSGEVVSGRRAKRDDLKRHNCVDARELPNPTGGKIKSRKLQRKYNLPESVMSEDAK